VYPFTTIRTLAVVTTLLCTACTETKTVVREVPAASSSDTTDDQAFADPNEPDDADAAPAGETETPGLGDGLEDLPDLELAPRLPDPDTVSGTPGQIVDCAFVVPCRWLDADAAFAVTVTSVDDTGAQGGLSVAFGVAATHDTEVSFGGGSAALGADGARFQPVARVLGGGNGIAPTGLLASESLEGHIDYATVAAGTELARWSVALTDNGFVREAVFVNLPSGPAPSASVDCALDLPCTWLAGDGGASVTLGSAGGLDSARRLSTGFSVTTVEATALALEGASAVGDDGTPFDGRTHTLGTANGFAKIAATTVAGLPTAGSVSFARTGSSPAALSRLELALYRDAPVPRWSIVFENVPLP